MKGVEVDALVDHLLPELQRRFADRGPRLEAREGGARIRIPSIHPEVGDIVIDGHDDEFTVYYGEFTHTHHGGFNANQAEGVKEAVASVVTELTAVFEERLKMWGDRRGGALSPIDYEGFRVLGLVTIFKPRGRVYVWSGPIDERRRDG